MTEYHYDVEKERLELEVSQIKDSFFSELFEEMIADLCVYLQCYGSAPDIKEMEEKYGFDYHKVLREIGYDR